LFCIYASAVNASISFLCSINDKYTMFSGSNSYLGGQSGRPGGPQQFNSFQQQPQPQQQNAFLNPNPTGYGAPAPLQQSYTGYPMQPQQTGFQQQQPQPQSTGFPGQQQPSQFNSMQPPQQQSFQTGAVPPMPPSIPTQFQSQPQQQQAAAPVKPQPTGFAAMADSFKASGSSTTTGRGRRASKATGAKIPSIRLSFITVQDQAKFEQLFKSAVGDGQTLSGDKSRDLLMRSKLDGNSLSQIW
jgi:hypothetical protein